MRKRGLHTLATAKKHIQSDGFWTAGALGSVGAAAAAAVVAVPTPSGRQTAAKAVSSNDLEMKQAEQDGQEQQRQQERSKTEMPPQNNPPWASRPTT